MRANPIHEEPCIRVLSLPEAAAHIAMGNVDVGALISIGDPATPEPDFVEGVGVPALRIEFTDVEDPEEPGAPDEGDVGTIMAFLLDVLPDLGDSCLVIHCNLGWSRSTAAALIAYSMALGSGREAEAMERMLEVRPIAAPNLLMVEYADKMMHRDGRLVDVVEERR